MVDRLCARVLTLLLPAAADLSVHIMAIWILHHTCHHERSTSLGAAICDTILAHRR